MSVLLTCQHCRGEFISQRPHGRFCSDACRAADWRGNSREAGSERVLDGTRDRSGARGGDTRDLDTARDLQSSSPEKDRWGLIVREQIARTLLATGYCHADDLHELGVPIAHANLIGSEMARFANRKLMESTGVYRKVEHRAANGRKAPIYRITEKGRVNLTAEVGADQITPRQGESLSRVPDNRITSPDLGGADAQPNSGTPAPQGPGSDASPGIDLPRRTEAAS